jgi:hypothetical protein
MSEMLVDDLFAGEVSRLRWHRNGAGYMCGFVNGRQVLLHRYVWALANDGNVPRMLDHINGNKLDNRIANLRPATGSLNCRSRLRSNGGRLPEGVQPKPGKNPFFAHICLWRATLYLGSFADAETASASYEKARRIMLACEAKRAEAGDEMQPVPPAARSSLKRRWNKGWRAILTSDDFQKAVDLACKFAREFVPGSAEVAA